MGDEPEDVIDIYENILRVQNDSTRRLLLLQFGAKYFPELCKVLKGE